MNEKTFRFTKDHEWISIPEGGISKVGISNHAQAELGDIVYIELPEPPTDLSKGDSAATVESVKAASDVYSPISGEIVETNDAIEQEPEIINQSPFEEGWFFKIRPHNIEELSELLSPEEYSEICDD